MFQLIKEAGCYDGITPRDDLPVTEVLNQVCPSTWRGACKTAVQLLFGQAGLVSKCERVRTYGVAHMQNTAQAEAKGGIAGQPEIHRKTLLFLQN